MKVGVIGSGTMGAGIVQVLAMHGHEVVMNARHQESVDKGIAKVEKSLSKLVAKEKIAAEAKDAAMALITGTTDIAGVKDADLIIGPIGIAVADSLLGEVSARMAAAVGQSSAKKILIPLNKCDILIPGLRDKSTSEVLADALNMIRAIMEGKL